MTYDIVLMLVSAGLFLGVLIKTLSPLATKLGEAVFTPPEKLKPEFNFELKAPSMMSWALVNQPKIETEIHSKYCCCTKCTKYDKRMRKEKGKDYYHYMDEDRYHEVTV